jgi:hypothetical protein
MPKAAAKRAKTGKVTSISPASPAERRPPPERRSLVVDFGKLLARIRGRGQADERFDKTDSED